MIEPLRTHYSMENLPSVYNEEAMTALELAGRTAKKTNECVDVINRHLEDCKQEHEQHQQHCRQEHERHRDDVDNEIKKQNQVIQGAKEYMQDNLYDSCGNLFDKAVEDGLFDTIPREAYQKMTTGVFNVLEYGATGDGVTDDSGAIQRAIDEAKQVKGSTVYIPSGKYAVYSPLTIYSHTRLIGGGKRGLSDTGYSGTHIVGYNAVNAVIQSDPEAQTIYGAEIHDIRVCSNNSHDDQLYEYGIFLNGASECYLHNVTVNGGFITGLHFKGTITNLDNLYVCGNSTGIELEEAHAVTVSNLNAWQQSVQGILLTGRCYNVVVRDSWIENTPTGIQFGNYVKSLLCYNTVIQNTSFTAGSSFNNARFISSAGEGGDEGRTFCLQGLMVNSCVVKINSTQHAVFLEGGNYTLKATFENNTFFTDNSYTSAIKCYDTFANILLKNNNCQNYEGTLYPVINSECANYCQMNVKSKYTEIDPAYPLRLTPMNHAIQGFDEGQFYYKEGHLRVTNGTKACIIPVQGEAVGLTSATTVEELKTAFNNLLNVLKDCKVIG